MENFNDSGNHVNDGITLTDRQLDVLKSSVENGGHYLKVYRLGEDPKYPEKDKHPAHKWRKQPATFEDLRAWISQGRVIGVIPATIGYAVFDCDNLNSTQKRRFIKRYPYTFALRSSDPNSGKGHFYYKYDRESAGLGNGDWYWEGVQAGEIRHDNGYIILWDLPGFLDAISDSKGTRGEPYTFESFSPLTAESHSVTPPPNGVEGEEHPKAPDGTTLITNALDLIRNTPEGTRHNTFRDRVYSLACDQLIDESNRQAFVEAALESGLDERDATDAFNGGLEKARNDPKVIYGIAKSDIPIDTVLRGVAIAHAVQARAKQLGYTIPDKGKPKQHTLEIGDIAYILATIWHDRFCVREGLGEQLAHLVRDDTSLWSESTRGGELSVAVANALTLIRGMRSTTLETKGQPLIGKNVKPSTVKTEVLEFIRDFDDWDKDAYEIGLPTGEVLNLKSGDRRQATHADKITKQLNYAPIKAPCPIWEDTVLAHICKTDDEREWLHQFCGVAMLGEILEPLFLFFQGRGGGGKTTFAEILKNAFGTYAHVIAAEKLVNDRYGAHHSQWLALLRGKRFAVAPDLPNGAWDTSKLKPLVSGDSMSANLMRENDKEIRPVATLMMSGNHRPSMLQVDSGLDKRLVLIAVDKLEKEDPYLEKRIVSEMPAIVNWCIEGLRTYLESGVRLRDTIPTRWAEDAKEYQRDQNPIQEWIETCVEFDPEASTYNTLVTKSYNAHTGRNLKYITTLKQYFREHDHYKDLVTQVRINGLDHQRGFRVTNVETPPDDMPF